MEKNTTNYKFLNAKDRASERKNSPEIFTRKPRSRCSERRMADEHRTE